MKLYCRIFLRYYKKSFILAIHFLTQFITLQWKIMHSYIVKFGYNRVFGSGRVVPVV